MIRTSLYFGLWATLCVALAAEAFQLYFKFLVETREPLPIISGILRYSPIVGVVAGLGWWLLHRRVPKPTWWRYALLAIAVVVVCHVLMVLMIVFLFRGEPGIGLRWQDLLEFAYALGAIFMLHAKLSVPVALIGTALFVLWNRRHAAA